MEEMRREAQALLGQSLLGWLSRGHPAFKPPHWSFLINTLSCAWGLYTRYARRTKGGVFFVGALARPPTLTPHANNTPAIATHRGQFLPLIAGTLGGLLSARFAPEGEEDAAHM